MSHNCELRFLGSPIAWAPQPEHLVELVAALVVEGVSSDWMMIYFDGFEWLFYEKFDRNSASRFLSDLSFNIFEAASSRKRFYHGDYC